jgi:hypothetical protein
MVYTGIPKIVKQDDHYTVSTHEDTLLLPSSTYFYNSFRVPDIDHDMGNLPKISHTHLYTMPQAEVPKTVIILGGGRSTIWAGLHFPNTLFACIKSKAIDFPLFKSELLSENILPYDKEDFIMNNIFEIRPSIEQPEKAIILDKENKGRDFEGGIYCAMGLKPRFDITQSVHKDNLLKYPYVQFTWVAAQDELPVGSLVEATLRWAFATENMMWAYETYCYHEESFINVFTHHMENVGIVLPYTFFDELRKNILGIAEQKEGIRKAPTHEETVQIYLNSFTKACGNDISSATLIKFEAELRKIESNRIERYDAVLSKHPSI